jgi:hypothetical protein
MTASRSGCSVAYVDLSRACRLLALGWLIALAVGACGGTTSPSDQQQVTQVLHSYLSAQARADGGRACALLTAGAQQHLIAFVAKAAKGSITTQPSCADAVALVSLVAGPQLLHALSSARVENVQVHGSRATADVTDGTQFPPQRVSLEKVGTAWRIAGVPALGA